VRLDILPLLLFPAAGILAAVVALELRRAQRELFFAAAGLCLLSGLCLIYEIVAIAMRANIRVDLLLTLPLISMAALLLGAFTFRRSPGVSRPAATGLLVAGGVSLAWYSWAMVESGQKARQLTRIFDAANKLYWEETIRCQASLARRFGPLGQRDQSCHGNLRVASRSEGSYPFTRLIVTDNGDLYLFYSPEAGVETNWLLQDGAALQLQGGPQDALSGESGAGNQRLRVELRPLAEGTCQASVERAGYPASSLTLRAEILPSCENPPEPPVRFLGAWGTVVKPPNAPKLRQLIQVWLWKTDSAVQGLLVETTGVSGQQRRFNFARQLRGIASAEKEWNLAVVDEDGSQASQHLVVTLLGEQAQLAGSAARFGSAGNLLLDRQELVSHPKIALVPLYDPLRFAQYVDNVLFNLDVPWTVP